MSNSLKYRIRTPEVVYETIEGETVIVNLENGLYYSLSNQTGSDVWNLIEAGFDFSNICIEISSKYSQDEQEINPALRDFFILLQQEGLIEVDQHPVSIPAENTSPLSSYPGRMYEPPQIERFSDMQDLLLIDPIHDVDETGWPNLPNQPQN